MTFNEADVRQAQIQIEGNLTWPAARFAAPRTDLKQFIDATPALQAVIHDLQEDVDDEAESGLRDAVCAGDKSAVCFCLKTLGSFGTPPLPGAASWASSAPAGEACPQSFPEDRDDAYVDEDTEMERVLSRIYSGPDLEKALGRKPRLGLAGDKPYDCPVDPATGLLKQRPALPTLPQPPEEPAPRRREPDSGDTG